MTSFRERIGGFRRYGSSAGLVFLGVAMLFWPGRLGSDDPNGVFVALGALIVVAAMGWLLLALDRQVSDDPRYRRPVYTEDDEED